MRAKDRRPRASKRCKNARIRAYADRMASRMTKPEWGLWKLLRMQNHMRWLPQYPVNTFKKWHILDFYLKHKRLAVEIDGPDHNPEYDRWRDAVLWETHGIKTMRFTNEEVMYDPFGVVCRICQRAK